MNRPHNKMLATASLLVVFLVSGCDIDPFCVDNCDGEDSGTDSGDDSGRDGGTDADGDGDSDGDGDADGDSDADGDVECIPGSEEECNGRDDNCDGEIDEGFDFETDQRHCGGCNSPCIPDHAFSQCLGGECVIDVCDVCFHDNDESVGNGCEYACCLTSTVEVEGSCVQGDGGDGRVDCCDGLDNDCDGEFDEDHDTSNDPHNCGGCSATCEGEECAFVCDYSLGIPGCADSVCFLAGCIEGHHDANHDDSDGCEYACTPNPDTDGVEICNSRDDDCDGEVDEEFDGMGVICGDATGACEQGVMACISGHEVCDGEVVSTLEICNGVDDDCDGETDEDDSRLGGGCGTDMGECTRGIYACIVGVLTCEGSIAPGLESCDGLDNDCNGVVDDGVPDEGPCGDDTGECSPGTRVCLGARFVCDGSVGPVLEDCDGLDNDCDGLTDEDLLRDCSSDCGIGEETCSSGAWGGCTARTPEVEACDGIDNDCDGLTDEDDAGGPLGRDCVVGICGGQEMCTAPFTWGSCSVSSSPEDCNGIDDDCDGEVDEGSDDGELTRSCSSDCGFGEEVCGAGGVWGSCSAREPSVEVCDGVDNDCDDVVDEDDSGARMTRPCSTDCGDGVETCTGPSSWSVCSAVEPTLEVCNGGDDDCDGVDDNVVPAPMDIANCGSCGHDCRGEIPHSAVRCNAGTCEFVACAAGWHDLDGEPGCEYECTVVGAEACNGVDDDCNGTVDDWTPPVGYCGLVGVCTGLVVECRDPDGAGPLPAAPYCDRSADYEETETRCDGLDNDCNGLTDENYEVGAGTTCSEGEGACTSTGHSECDPANDQQTICVIDVAGSDPTVELCNGLDDDCDGDIDEGILLANHDAIEIIADVDLNYDGELGGDEVGRSYRMFQYEASHPDATSVDGGTNWTYACSNQGVEPWTGVGWRDAQTACCGLNDGGACDYQQGDVSNPSGSGTVTMWLSRGWALCTAPDWEVSCQSDSHLTDPLLADEPWVYPYESDFYDPTACNGADLNPDQVATTGSLASCSGGDLAWTGDHFDMSGNVHEWTWTGWEVCGCNNASGCESDCACDPDCACACDTDASSRGHGSRCQYNNTTNDICACDPDCNTFYEYRGGSFRSVEEALTCQFDFNVGADRSDTPSAGGDPEAGLALENLGFRCCYYPDL